MGKKKVSAPPAEPPKKPIPRSVDRHKQPRLAFHLPQRLLDAFNGYVQSLKGPPSESSILRAFLEEGLRNAGHWPPPDEDDS